MNNDYQIPSEIYELFRDVINNKSEMNKVLHYSLEELKKVDRFFDWNTIFQNMTNLGIIDDDEPAREYKNGLVEFYNKLLEEVRQIEQSDTDFMNEFEGEYGEYNNKLFHDDMVIGVCLLNDVKCYNEEEKKFVSLIGGCLLRKYKHDYSLARLTKLGDTSHLFDDPIDIQKRMDES